MDNLTLRTTPLKSRLILLPVDPYLIHAYWQIAPDDLRQAEKRAGPAAQPVLRFYRSGRIGAEGTGYFDVDVDLRTRNWYMHLWSAEEAFYADLALRKTDGTAICVARSPVIRMPRSVPAIPIDQHFMKVSGEGATPRAEVVPSPAPKPPAPLPIPPEVPPAQSPVPKRIDSNEIVREKLRELYTSVERRRPGNHVIQPEGPKPIPEQTPKNSSVRIPQVDLGAASERKFGVGLSSSSLQRKNPEGALSSRK